MMALGLTYVKNKTVLNFRPVTIGISMALLLLLLWHAREDNLLSIVFTFVKAFSFLVVISLSKDIITESINKYIKVFIVISVISLVAWCLYLLGIDIVNLGSITLLEKYKLSNHLLFVCDDNGRFQSLYIEPGYYGLLCITLMCLNRFRKDKTSLILLLCIAFSLSLASFLILAFILVFNALLIKQNLKAMIFPVLLIGSVYWYGMNYNNGDNIIYNKIIWRLSLNDDGELTFYNRTTKSFEYYFESTFLKSDDLITGIGSESYVRRKFENSVDYKAYFVLDGIIGIILLSLFYYLPYRMSKKRRSITVIVLYTIIFARGFVFSLVLGNLLLYYLNCFITKNEEEKNLICSQPK